MHSAQPKCLHSASASCLSHSRCVLSNLDSSMAQVGVTKQDPILVSPPQYKRVMPAKEHYNRITRPHNLGT